MSDKMPYFMIEIDYGENKMTVHRFNLAWMQKTYNQIIRRLKYLRRYARRSPHP